MNVNKKDKKDKKDELLFGN